MVNANGVALFMPDTSTTPFSFRAPMSERDPLLIERNKTHGSFVMNAHYSQMIKAIMHGADCWAGMPNSQKEALEMIAFKVSRILSGQTMFKDHWDDVAGYAKLGSEACDNP